MNDNSKNRFGWKIVFENYTIWDIFKDCKYPSCISLILTLMIFFASSNIFVSLQRIISWSIGIIPNVLALLLAGYAIVLTVFWSDYGKNIRKYKSGRKLLNNINSSYAATTLIMAITILLNLTIDLIASFEISASVTISRCVNTMAIFFIITLLTFSIWLLKDITINIFNLGQASSIFDDETNDKVREEEELPIQKNKRK
jgi:uncharacterized membrane protein